MRENKSRTGGKRRREFDGFLKLFERSRLGFIWEKSWSLVNVS